MQREDVDATDVPLINFDDETGDVIPFRYSITSYGTDFPVDSIVDRIKREDIYIPDFQRYFVWSLPQSSRFIESLLLGLPVPGVFLSKDEESKRHLVIDGQQRLTTLEMFYNERFVPTDRTFALSKVQPDFEGKTYSTLPPEDRRTLDDAVLHATIVRQDNPTEDRSSIYHVFERLNTGGTSLTPQEIRAAVYYGVLNSLLKELIALPKWNELFGKPNRRMRDAELVLRFFAFYYEAARYAQPMKSFLNAYMARHRNPDEQSISAMHELFTDVVAVVCDHVGPSAFKPKGPLNAAVFDAVMVGVARRMKKGPVLDNGGWLAAYQKLMNDAAFLGATETGTSSDENVSTRLEQATEAFSEVR